MNCLGIGVVQGFLKRAKVTVVVFSLFWGVALFQWCNWSSSPWLGREPTPVDIRWNRGARGCEGGSLAVFDCLPFAFRGRHLVECLFAGVAGDFFFFLFCGGVLRSCESPLDALGRLLGHPASLLQFLLEAVLAVDSEGHFSDVAYCGG